MKAEPTCSNEDPTTRRLPELTWTYWLGMLPNFTFHFPKSHKNPGVGGWVNIFGKDLPKKTFFDEIFKVDNEWPMVAFMMFFLIEILFLGSCVQSKPIWLKKSQVGAK